MLGTIALYAGGILLDSGWVRVLGSGHPRLGGGLREWNATLGGDVLDPPLDQALIVAYDAVGGFYAINGGAWPTAPGTMHYFAPDSFAWESLDIGHGDFIASAFSENLDQFYESWRWPGWEAEVGALGRDQVISIWPPLGLKGADASSSPVEGRSRRAVPAREHWSFMNDIGRQMDDLPDGASVRLELNRKTLEGPTPEEEPGLRADGWDPRAGYEVVARRAVQEMEQVERFNDDPGWRGERIRDVVAAREVIIEIDRMLYEGLDARGVGLDDVFSEDAVDATRRAFDSMPSFDVSVTLKAAYHRNPAHTWRPNHIHDIDALASTVPYCDIVVTDKEAASHLDRTGLADRFDTTVLSRIEDLAPLLDPAA